jgi:ferritin
MSMQTESLLIGVNGNLGSIIKRLDAMEQSISSLSGLFQKIIENQEVQTKLLQEMARASRAERDISELPDVV